MGGIDISSIPAFVAFEMTSGLVIPLSVTERDIDVTDVTLRDILVTLA